MSVIFILIACSLLLAGGFLGAYLWASNTGQFEDDYTPSVRMLFNDEEEMESPKEDVPLKIEKKTKSFTKPTIHVQ
jgi:cbb3-type cytochrome oxidase maturation protein